MLAVALRRLVIPVSVSGLLRQALEQFREFSICLLTNVAVHLSLSSEDFDLAAIKADVHLQFTASIRPDEGVIGMESSTRFLSREFGESVGSLDQVSQSFRAVFVDRRSVEEELRCESCHRRLVFGRRAARWWRRAQVRARDPTINDKLGVCIQRGYQPFDMHE